MRAEKRCFGMGMLRGCWCGSMVSTLAARRVGCEAEAEEEDEEEEE